MTVSRSPEDGKGQTDVVGLPSLVAENPLLVCDGAGVGWRGGGAGDLAMLALGVWCGNGYWSWKNKEIVR